MKMAIFDVYLYMTGLQRVLMRLHNLHIDRS